MSDDDRTRIVRPAATRTATEDATKVIGSGHPAPQTATGLNANEPHTRMMSSVDSPSSSDKAEIYELIAGWLVVIAGPGRGSSREIFFGMNSVGRNRDQRIALDFGDESISRDSHAFIVYDDVQHDFYIQHGGKANLVRLNGKPVLAPTELKNSDVIEIGATRLMFVPLCSHTFNWSETEAK